MKVRSRTWLIAATVVLVAALTGCDASVLCAQLGSLGIC